MTPTEEERLIKSFAAGNWQAFNRLWLSHTRYLIQYANASLLGQTEEVDDVLSKVKVKFITNLKAGKIQKCSAWLKRVTYNACMDVYRRQKKDRKLLERLQLSETASDRRQIALNSNTDIRWPIVEKILGDYPLKERLIIISSYVGGWDAKKIADLCDITEEKVYAETAKFRKAVRKELAAKTEK